jgi:phage regulator Rha-like protein
MTTGQIAEAYETTEKIVSQNYIRNKEHFVAGKHYFALEGKEKADFLNRLHFEDGAKHAKTLYLWTKRGAALHAKSITTQKAWEFYEDLVDFYFEVQEAKQSQQEQVRIYPWTEEAEQLRLINAKEIKPGYYSISAFVLTKLIYINLGGMKPNERAKIDISYGKFFPRWLRGDRSGQLKDCLIVPEHVYNKKNTIDVGHVVDSITGEVHNVAHYKNLYAGDCSNFWDLFYVPVILPVYFNGKLPDGLPRMQFRNDIQ